MNKWIRIRPRVINGILAEGDKRDASLARSRAGMQKSNECYAHTEAGEAKRASHAFAHAVVC